MTTESNSIDGLPRLANQTSRMLDKPKTQKMDIYLELADTTVLCALIQAIPHVGGSLDTLIFSKAEKIRHQRVEEYLHSIHRYIARVDAEKIDKHFFETEQGLSVFESALRAVIQEGVKEKRKVLAAFTVASSTTTLSKRTDHLFVLDCVARMSISQVVVLLNLAKEQLRIPRNRWESRWGTMWEGKGIDELHYTRIVDIASRALEKRRIAPRVPIAEILEGLMSMNLIAYPEHVLQEGGHFRYDCLAVTNLGASVYEYLNQCYVRPRKK